LDLADRVEGALQRGRPTLELTDHAHDVGGNAGNGRRRSGLIHHDSVDIVEVSRIVAAVDGHYALLLGNFGVW
jgi:hypothetical protein